MVKYIILRIYLRLSTPALPLSAIVVDDERELAFLFKTLLEKVGFRVEYFTDPLTALDFFKKNMNDFSVLLTDLRMPHMSGIELSCEVRKLNEKIKIILITAFIIDELQHSESYILAKIDQIVQKPVKISVLQDIIKQTLNCQI